MKSFFMWVLLAVFGALVCVGCALVAMVVVGTSMPIVCKLACLIVCVGSITLILVSLTK